MKFSPHQRKRIYEATQKVLFFFDRFFSLFIKLYEKPVEQRKRAFLLKYRIEMNEEEIREYQYQLTLRWTVGIFILILFLLQVGGKLFD